MVYVMAADELVEQGAWVAAARVLIYSYGTVRLQNQKS